MDSEEIKVVVREVLAEQKRLHNNEVDQVVLETISTILTSFGIEEEDRIELRKDFTHLRRWRKSFDQAESLTFKVVITTLVTGFLTALVLGIKAMLGK